MSAKETNQLTKQTNKENDSENKRKANKRENKTKIIKYIHTHRSKIKKKSNDTEALKRKDDSVISK